MMTSEEQKDQLAWVERALRAEHRLVVVEAENRELKAKNKQLEANNTQLQEAL